MAAGTGLESIKKAYILAFLYKNNSIFTTSRFKPFLRLFFTFPGDQIL
jgi:hypothetical protein